MCVFRISVKVFASLYDGASTKFTTGLMWSLTLTVKHYLNETNNNIYDFSGILLKTNLITTTILLKRWNLS
jgi:hypothetical protein